MEQTKKSFGLTAQGVRLWGYAFLFFGILSRSVLQNGLLRLQETDMNALLGQMQASRTVMLYATLALVFRALAACAVPIFAFLLAEGMVHTKDPIRYCVRLGVLALVCEVPYDLASSGRLFDVSSQNPVFALALAGVVLFFYGRAGRSRAAALGVGAVVTLAAFAWCVVLRVADGVPILLMAVVLWLCRRERLYQNFAGACAAALCGLFSPFFFAAPMGVMVLHFYQGERGADSHRIQYVVYPAMLLAGAAVSVFF